MKYFIGSRRVGKCTAGRPGQQWKTQVEGANPLQHTLRGSPWVPDRVRGMEEADTILCIQTASRFTKNKTKPSLEPWQNVRFNAGERCYGMLMCMKLQLAWLLVDGSYKTAKHHILSVKPLLLGEID